MARLDLSNAYYLIVLVFFVLLSACDNGSDSKAPTARNTGSISFGINGDGQSDSSETSGTADTDSDYCMGDEVATIRATLYDKENQFIVSREWPCDNFPAVIHDIPAPQEDVALLLVAKNNDNHVVYRGEKGGLTVQAIADNDAGAVDLFRFPPPAVTLSDDPVRIQWHSVTGAVAYRVVISQNEDFSNPVINTLCEITEFTPMGLAPVTLYYIQIFARDGRATESAGSEIGSFTTGQLPDAPTNVSAAGELHKVTLNWEGETDAVFNVYWSTTPGVTQDNHEDKFEKIEGATLVHENLQGNTTYYYRVSALNSVGQESRLSDETSATAVGLPTGPDNVTAEAGDRKVTLKWTATEGFVYNIYWSTEPGVSKTHHQKKIENIDTDTYVHDDCESTQHYYIVTAKNDLGEGEPLGEVTAAPGWIELLGGAGKDYLKASTIDDRGNMYFAGSTDIPLGDMPALGKFDGYLAKYDRQGVQQWIRTFGTSENESVYNLGMDVAGNIYIVGSTQGIWRDGITNPGSLIYLLKLNPEGEEQWIQFPLEMTDHETEMKRPVNIAVDPMGNSYINGDIKTSVEWDSFDVFTMKYDTDGKQLWSDYLHTRYDEKSGDIALDDQGNAYVTGSTEGDLGDNENSSFANSDVFVAKYAAQDGALQWLKLLGDIFNDTGYRIAVKENVCFVSGYYDRPIQGAAQPDLYLARFKSDNGQHEWTTFIEDARPHTYPTAMTFTSSGKLLMGAVSRVASIDDQANAGEPDAEGVYTYDALAMTFDPADGHRLWSKLFGSPTDDYAWAGFKLDAEGYAYIGGESYGDFGGHSNAGEIDAFAWKLYVGP